MVVSFARVEMSVYNHAMVQCPISGEWRTHFIPIIVYRITKSRSLKLWKLHALFSLEILEVVQIISSMVGRDFW